MPNHARVVAILVALGATTVALPCPAGKGRPAKQTRARASRADRDEVTALRREIRRLSAEVVTLRARPAPVAPRHEEPDPVDHAAVTTIAQIALAKARASERMNHDMGFRRTPGVFVKSDLTGPTRYAAQDAIRGQLQAVGLSYLSVSYEHGGFRLSW